MPGRTQNVSEHAFTKSTLCQRGHKMHLNMCWPKPTHASKDIKCISTCFDQNSPKSARTQNLSEYVLTKSIPCQRWLKMYLNMCWANITYANKDKKCISTCTVHTLPIPARTQSVSQFDLTKPVPWLEDTNCISTCVDQTSPMKTKNTKCISTLVDQIHPITARTQNASQLL